MRWINVKSVEDLKSLGKFKDVKQEIKNDIGDNTKIAARGWNDLYENVSRIINLYDCLYNAKENDSNITPKPSTNTYEYFTSKANEYIFYLTELDGEIRMKKLGITKSLFSNKTKAKSWRDNIAKEIYPDLNDHPKSTLAMSKLNDMYSSMVGKNKK